MTADAGPREELLAATDGLSDEQARTLLGWIRMMRREPATVAAEHSMGGAIQPNLPEGEHCATIEVKVSYLASVREGTLTVETEVVKQGRNIAFTESKVTDERGRLVATASGSMFIIRADERSSAPKGAAK